MIVDASVVVTALAQHDHRGRWAEEQLLVGKLAAPYLLGAEVANALRSAELRQLISSDVASLSHADFADIAITFYPYAPFADRIWELRTNLTPYDAWYVAMAEALDEPLATLDLRLAEAPGPRCRFITP